MAEDFSTPAWAEQNAAASLGGMGGPPDDAAGAAAAAPPPLGSTSAAPAAEQEIVMTPERFLLSLFENEIRAQERRRMMTPGQAGATLGPRRVGGGGGNITNGGNAPVGSSCLGLPTMALLARAAKSREFATRLRAEQVSAILHSFNFSNEQVLQQLLSPKGEWVTGSEGMNATATPVRAGTTTQSAPGSKSKPTIVEVPQKNRPGSAPEMRGDYGENYDLSSRRPFRRKITSAVLDPDAELGTGALARVKEMRRICCNKVKVC